jgi:dihydrofolate reductase
VLTHHEREPITMQGGTTFHFVSDGIEAALERVVDAADGQDIRIGGGVATIQQHLRAGLVDELRIAVAPVLLGGGERLLDGDAPVGYTVTEYVASPSVAHYRLTRTA